MTELPAVSGAQAERTLMSWERSAFGFLVGGALVLLRQHGPLGVGRTLLAAFAGLLALVALFFAYRRSRQLRGTGDHPPAVAAPTVEILLLGYGTALFAAAIAAVLLFAS